MPRVWVESFPSKSKQTKLECEKMSTEREYLLQEQKNCQKSLGSKLAYQDK